jgi:hypothetical protein
MIKPTKYKSISVVELKNRPVLTLTNTEKTRVFSILNKFTNLIKVKHS